MRKVLVMVVGLMLLGGGDIMWRAYAADAASPKGGRAKSVSPTTPEKTFTAEGTIVPEECVDVCAQVTGIVTSLGRDPQAPGKPLDYGSTVEVNTVLATVDESVYRARLEEKEAGYRRAVAELGLAGFNVQFTSRELRRAQERKVKKTITDSEYDKMVFNDNAARASAEAAKATVAQNRAALGLAKRELLLTRIISPVKGVIIDRRVSPGQLVVPNTTTAATLFVIGRIDKLEVWASVPDWAISHVHQDQPVSFTLAGNPGVFHGKVMQIRLNATMTQNASTYTVVVAISSPADKMLPYMRAHLTFE